VLPVYPEVQVRFSALPDFLRSSGSGTGSTQPPEYNWGRKGSGSDLESREYWRRDLSLWSRGTPYLEKLALTSLTSGGRLMHNTFQKWFRIVPRGWATFLTPVPLAVLTVWRFCFFVTDALLTDSEVKRFNPWRYLTHFMSWLLSCNPTLNGYSVRYYWMDSTGTSNLTASCQTYNLNCSEGGA
jgi:hypothetical protein